MFLRLNRTISSYPAIQVLRHTEAREWGGSGMRMESLQITQAQWDAERALEETASENERNDIRADGTRDEAVVFALLGSLSLLVLGPTMLLLITRLCLLQLRLL